MSSHARHGTASRPSGTAGETNPATPATSRSRLTALLLAGQIAFAIAIVVTTGMLILHLRDHALRQAKHEQHNLSLILADQAERSFEAVELVQTAIVERLQQAGIRTPEAFRQLMSSAAVSIDLRNHGRMLPQLDAIVISDAAGDVINSSRLVPVSTPPVNIADRDFYQALKAHPEQTTFISEPVVGHFSRQWAMFIARRVSGPEGEFLGIVEGAVQLRYFEELYRSIAPSGSSSIGLFRHDGRLLARYPHVELRAGYSYANNPEMRSLMASGPDGTVVRAMSQLDGLDRLIAGRALGHYPIVVTVANSIASILAEWQSQSIYLIGSALTLELVIAAIGLIMLRQLRSQKLLDAAHRAREAADTARNLAEAALAVSHERERAEQVLGLQNVRFGAAMGNMSQALCMFDKSGSLVVANASLAAMFGMPTGTIAPGVTIDSLLGQSPDAFDLPQSDKDTMHRCIQSLQADNVRATDVLELEDGRVLGMSFVPVADGGWLVTIEDVTERRQVTAKMAHMAHHDALTGLPNRVLFHDRLTAAVARSRRGEPCAVLYLDLDHFKSVNDTLGHPTGDALLQEVTRRLQSQIRETDTVARLGGDEFAIVQSSVDQPTDATALARRLIEVLGAPYEVNGHQVMTGTSVGIAIVPTDGEDPDQILKCADLALYRAKADGRGRYRFFEPDMDARMQERRSLELEMRKALNTDGFEVFYQPLMNIKTHSISGFEALLRWRHPERGMVSPADFVPLAEEIGLIVPLGVWVLNRACCDAATWPADMKLAVNVSVIQFGSPTLVEDVAAALQASGLHPSRLELEITETVMLDDTEAILVILHQLRDLGVGIAMDDFGTGYSSLSYLRRFPFSKVKIDRSFISGLGQGTDCDAIVTAVTELCLTLGMTTVAEGVENEEQLRQLRAGNCTEAQGYLFSPARPASEVAALCRRLTQRDASKSAVAELAS